MNLTEYFLTVRKDGELKGEVKSPDTIDDAYIVQNQNRENLGVVKAWKLGGTTAHTRNLFFTNETYYGAVFQPGVKAADNKIILPEFISKPFGEAEVCFRLSANVETLNKYNLNDIEIDTFITSVMPSIELPWSPFPLPDSGLNVLIADTCASGALIYGSEIKWAVNASELLQGAIKVKTNDGLLTEGLIENIIDGPLVALYDFLRLAKKHKLRLREGQLVATGGCTPCVQLPVAQEISVEFKHLGKFIFEVRAME